MTGSKIADQQGSSSRKTKYILEASRTTFATCMISRVYMHHLDRMIARTCTVVYIEFGSAADDGCPTLTV